MNGVARLAVVGAGLVGRRHAAAISASKCAQLCALADPNPHVADVAFSYGVKSFSCLGEVLAEARPDGVVLATPNRVHASGAIEAIEAGVPVLVEKPFVDKVEDGVRVLDLARERGVPVLCGHHRRHNALAKAAKARIDAGDLGRIVAVNAMAWLMKPASYFDAAWRREPGGGPIWINLIHDIDLVCYFAGNVEAVTAVATNAYRENPVEDAAAIALRFESGAVGTLTLSDTIVAPWSWELTAAENPAYPVTDGCCYYIGGTHGSLELPTAAFWSQGEERSWWSAISRTNPVRPPAVDPLVAQIENFAAVIAGEDEPVASGQDGLRAVAVVHAIHRAAASGGTERPFA